MVELDQDIFKFLDNHDQSSFQENRRMYLSLSLLSVSSLALPNFIIFSISLFHIGKTNSRQL